MTSKILPKNFTFDKALCAPKPTQSQFLDIENKMFGKLLCQGYAGNGLWFCLCECGKSKIIEGHSLRRGKTLSCGCLRDESTRLRFKTHGYSSTPEYESWLGMKKRCHRTTSKDYKDYGGRGIKVCRRWRESFMSFFIDLGERPSPVHSIDRKDNESHYSCGNCEDCKTHEWTSNCRWATSTEQANNTSRNHKIRELYT